MTRSLSNGVGGGIGGGTIGHIGHIGSIGSNTGTGNTGNTTTTTTGTTTTNNPNNPTMTSSSTSSSGASIVSSIEFDRDDEYFATAGVTRKIKIFDMSGVLDPRVTLHLPVRELACRSKISCVSWNGYIKSHLASSDYDGVVTVWDVSQGRNSNSSGNGGNSNNSSNEGAAVVVFEEHEKRAWSVDYSRTDPTKIASGSDDAKGAILVDIVKVLGLL